MTNEEWIVDQLNILNDRDLRAEEAAVVFPKVQDRLESQLRRLIQTYMQVRGSKTNLKMMTTSPLTFTKTRPEASQLVVRAFPEGLHIEAAYNFNGSRSETEQFKVNANTNESTVDGWIRQILSKFLFPPEQN